MMLRAFALLCLTALCAQQTALCADAKQYSATLRSEDLALTFQGDEHGLRLSSIRNTQTGAEYLPTTPGSGLSDGASGPATPHPFGNPFAVAVLGQGARTLQASADTDILTWASSPSRLRVQFQFRGLLLSGEMTVSIGRSHAFWQCTLHNDSSEALQAAFYFPAFSGLCAGSPKEDRVFIPTGTGVSRPAVLQPPLRSLYGDQLTSPVAVLHGRDQGLYLVDNSRVDLSLTADGCYARSMLVGAPSEASGAKPDDVGTLLGIANEVRIQPGGSLTVGPVILGCYQGQWTVGLERARLARTHIFRPHSAPRWLRSAPVLAAADAALENIAARLQTAGAGILLLTGLPGPDGADIQTSGAVRALADQVHASGAKLILAVNARTISQKAPFAQTTDGKDAVCRDITGKPEEPQPGLWAMCVADRRWQDRVAETCARLVRSYGADGIALTGLGTGWSTPCYTPSHKHPTPFVANWGLRNLLKAVRARLDRISPDLALLSSCTADFVREYADAVITDAPASISPDAAPAVTRALCPDAPMYIALPKDAARAEVASAWALVEGIGLVVDLSAEATPAGVKRLLQYVQAVPDLLTAPVLPLEGAAVSSHVCVRVFAGTRTIVTAANLGEDAYLEGFALPDSISLLEDPVTKLRTERGPGGRFPAALMPRRACLWIAQ